jgi:signal transduction histidine kinase
VTPKRLWVRLRRDFADALIVALAWAIFVEEVATNRSFNAAVIYPLSVFFALPLLFRRRWPLPAVLVPFGALSLAAALDSDGFNHLVMPMFAAFAATVAAGALLDRAELIAGVAGGLVAVSVFIVTSGTSASDVFLIVVVFSAAWLAGRAIATRTQQTRELLARVQVAERARAEAADRAALEERSRIARELHDVVAHSISVMVVQASGVRRLLHDDQGREREALMSVEQIGRQALSEMRRMLGVMRTDEEHPPALAPQPSLEHLDRLIDEVEKAGLSVHLHVEGDRIPLSPGVDLSAYRIVQEGLTNALKHAKGSRADVFVRYVGDGVELSIEDDGPGMPSANGLGHGLVGMRERVALYGGTLEAGPRAEGGFALRAKLPVEGRG